MYCNSRLVRCVATITRTRQREEPLAIYRQNSMTFYIPAQDQGMGQRMQEPDPADSAHDKLLAPNYEGSERSTHRTIAQVKAVGGSGIPRSGPMGAGSMNAAT
jgi:hypothetical protein